MSFFRKIMVLSLFACAAMAGAENSLLGDGNFSEGNKWICWIDSSISAAGGSLTLRQGRAIAKIPRESNANFSHSVQLIKMIDLEPDRKYSLQFKADTTATGKLNIIYCLAKAPYTHDTDNPIQLEPGKHNYECVISMKKASDGSSKAPRSLRFFFGDLKGAEVTIYDISLREELVFSPAVSWSLFLNARPPSDWGAIPEQLSGVSGSPVKPKLITLENHAVDLAALVKTFTEKSCAILYNQFTAEKPGVMSMGFSADWWAEVYLNGSMVYSTVEKGNGSHLFQCNDHIVELPVNAGKNLLAVKVLSGSEGWRFVCGTPSRKKGDIEFSASSEWKAADMEELKIKAGSALDLTSVSELPMKGANLPRLTIGASGKLVAENDPDRPIRLKGYTFTQLQLNTSDEQLEEQVVSARRQGYNLFRFMTLDNFCYKNGDLSIRKDWLDKFDFLMSKMKEHGVYLYINMFSYGFYRNLPWADSVQQGNDLKARMYLGDPTMRNAWKYGAETLMNHVNSYTGKAWKEEPVIACIEFFNEQEFGLIAIDRLSSGTQAAFTQRFRLWLKDKYGNADNLARHWNDKAIASFEQVTLPEHFRDSGMKSNDFLLFCNELSRENIRWCAETLRAAGYKGLTSQYNLSYGLGNTAVKFEESQVNINNTYFHHPSNQSNPGSECQQDSSVCGSANYWRYTCANRFFDRPFFFTEFNHAFWNPYQHEGGILFGAYSALQGVDAMVIHCNAVVMKSKRIDAWSVGSNPVARANEFLSACLFLRGDVKPSPLHVELEIPRDYLESECRSAKGVSLESQLALICGFTISFPWAQRPVGVAAARKADLTLTPSGISKVKDGDWFSEIVESPSSKVDMNAHVAKMKAADLLPKTNNSDPARGIFQSDTGQITMRSHENLLKVVTARSEAVSLEAGKGESIAQLNVIHTSVPALVAACSIDGRSLENSKRIVFIYSTDVVNSGQKVSDNRVTLIDLGHLPVLLRIGRVNATLKNINAANMSFYALSIDGSRREKLPIPFRGDTLNISIDTAILKNGPTVFFELATEPPNREEKR